MDLEWRTANSNGNQLLNQEIYIYLYICVCGCFCVCVQACSYVCMRAHACVDPGQPTKNYLDKNLTNLGLTI